jgi:NADH-quinone oxidoreductase subunit A
MAASRETTAVSEAVRLTPKAVPARGDARTGVDERDALAAPRIGLVNSFTNAREVAARMETYVPVLILGLIAGGFAVFSVVMGAMTGPKRYNRAKYDSYECGIEPTPQPVGGGRFPVKYYLTAMLFIVFDIEIVFLYPWAVAFNSLGWFGLSEMVLFILTVFVAYAYVWRRGGLEWD